ncbi:MAG: AAA family ATPase [Bradymonadia bacterium]
MNIQPGAQELSAYFPRWIAQPLLHRLRDHQHPSMHWTGAVLFLDISGFSALTRRFQAEDERDGFGRLQGFLNEAFDELARVIEAYGGTLLTFVGDALLAFWGAEAAQQRERQLSCAARAGLDALGCVDGLSVHGSVAWGDICTVLLGGYEDVWSLLSAGDAISQASVAMTTALPGQLKVASGARCGGLIVDDEGILLGVEGSLMPLEVPSTPPPLQSEQLVPAHARDAVLLNVHWAAQLRTLTAVFVRLDHASVADMNALKALQAVVERSQRTLHAHHGVLDRLSQDDKGLCVVAEFGMRGSAGAGPVHALQWALALRAKLKEVGQKCSVGVATGRMFIGPIGAKARHTFTVMGEAVNRAAHLMQYATDAIICDEATARGCDGQIDLRSAKTITLKHSHQVSVFEVTQLGPTAHRPQVEMIGRANEFERALGLCRELWEDGGGFALIGEAGIGKSTLIRQIVSSLGEEALPVCACEASAMTSTQPYRIWGDVIRQMLSERLELGLDIHTALESMLSTSPESVELLPLLNTVLGTRFPETPATVLLDGQTRIDNTKNLIVNFLECCPRKLLVIEDAHWMDTASWALLTFSMQKMERLGVVLVMRPRGSIIVGERVRFELDPRTNILVLEALEEAQVEALIKESVGVSNVHPEVLSWLYTRGQGHPFFTRELLDVLKSSRLIDTVGDQLIRTPTREELANTHLPDTIEGAVGFRVDQLRAPEQYVLRVASVLGQKCEYGYLLEVLAAIDVHVELDDALRHLDEVGLLSGSASEELVFVHRYVQEVAYSSLPEAQREVVHTAAAKSLERDSTEGTEEVSTLAFHWRHTDNDERALHYLEAAGRAALDAGAYFEAAEHLKHALERDEGRGQREDDLVSSSRRASWLRLLSDAWFGLGDVERWATSARRSIEEAGWSVPRRQVVWLGRFYGGLIRQLGHRTLGRWRRQAPERLGHLCYEGALAAGRLSQAQYFLHAPIAMAGAGLMAVNLLEKGDRAEPVPSAYGMLGVAFGMMRLNWLARWYLSELERRAQGRPSELALGLFHEAMWHSCFCRWEFSYQSAERGAEVAASVDARTELRMLQTLIASNHLFTGEYRDSVELMSRVRASAIADANLQHEGWSYNVSGNALVFLGNYEEALMRASRAVEIFNRLYDDISLYIALSRVGIVNLYQGKYLSSVEYADKVLVHIKKGLPSSNLTLDSNGWMCEVFIHHLERQSDCEEWKRKSRAALSEFRRFAWVFPNGRARYLYYKARYAAAMGKTSMAHRLYARSLKAAQRYNMPYDEAMALAGYASCSMDKKLRVESSAQAHALMDELGVPWPPTVPRLSD